MPDIKDLYLGDLTPSEVFKELKVRGVPEKEAALVVGTWIVDYFGRGPRKFKYATPLAPTEAECTPTFARRFQHSDWVDGESVVQAEDTPGEDGFNRRFHWIEQDLDALASDTARTFVCLAELRSQLATMLEEVKLELNRINEALGTRDPVGPVGPLGTGVFNPQILDATKFGGTTKFFGKDVTVWNTAAGTFVLPAVKGVGAIDPANDPGVRRAGDFARYLEENIRVREMFGNGPVTRAKLLSEFGNDPTASGRSVRDVLDALPADSEFASLDAVVTALAERDAANVRVSGMADPLLAAHFGLAGETATVGAARVERLEILPERARRALVTAGVDTVDGLAGRSAGEVSEILRREGVEMSRGEAAELIGRARTLTRIR